MLSFPFQCSSAAGLVTKLMSFIRNNLKHFKAGRNSSPLMFQRKLVLRNSHGMHYLASLRGQKLRPVKYQNNILLKREALNISAFLHLCYQNFHVFCSVGVATQLPYSPSLLTFYHSFLPHQPVLWALVQLRGSSFFVQLFSLEKIIHLHKTRARKLLDGDQLNKTLGTNKTYGVLQVFTLHEFSAILLLTQLLWGSC